MALTVGDVLPFATTVQDAAGVNANAGAMTLTVTLPDGTAAVGSPFTVTPTSTGLYDKDITSSMAGRYVGYWLATGLNSGAHTQTFDVRPAADASLASLADVKRNLNITSTTGDEELELMIQAATDVIEEKVGAVARRTITNERHDGGCGVVYLHHAPVISVASVTAVAAGGAAVTAGLLDVDANGRAVYLDGYSRYPAGTYFWTYIAGRVTVPASIQLAALVLVKGLWETQRGASGLPLQGMDELVEQPGMGLVMWRVEQLLQPYRAMPGIA